MAVDPRIPTRSERLTAKLSEPPAPDATPMPSESKHRSEWSGPIIGVYALVVGALSCLSFLATWQYIESIDEKEQVTRFGAIEERLARQHSELERLSAGYTRLEKQLLELGVSPQTSDSLQQAGVTPGFRLLVNGEELTLEEVARRLGASAPAQSEPTPSEPGEPEVE